MEGGPSFGAGDVLTAAIAGFTGYAGTNLDNLLLLLALAQGRSAARPVFGAAGAVMIAAGALGLGIAAVPFDRLHWLGLVPLSLGIWTLVRMRRGAMAEGPARDTRPRAPLGLVLLSNSGDTLAVLTALVVDTAPALRAGLALGVLAGASAVLLVLGRIRSNAALAAVMARQGAWLAPCVMIAVGLYILADTPTDTM